MIKWTLIQLSCASHHLFMSTTFFICFFLFVWNLTEKKILWKNYFQKIPFFLFLVISLFFEAHRMETDFVNFLNNASGSPYQATAECVRRLTEAGFVRLMEDQFWSLEHGKNYFFTRNRSSVFAFSIGSKYEMGNGYFLYYYYIVFIAIVLFFFFYCLVNVS